MSGAAGEVLTFDHVGVVCRGRLIVIVYGADARLHRTRWLFDQVTKLVGEHERLVVLMVIPEGANPPDAPTRAENTARLTRLKDRLDLLVTVPLGDAFFVSIVRTVMRGMAILSRQTQWNVVESSLAAAIDRVLEQPGTPTRARIVEDLEAVCAALDRDPATVLSLR